MKGKEKWKEGRKRERRGQEEGEGRRMKWIERVGVRPAFWRNWVVWGRKKEGREVVVLGEGVLGRWTMR